MKKKTRTVEKTKYDKVRHVHKCSRLHEMHSKEMLIVILNIRSLKGTMEIHKLRLGSIYVGTRLWRASTCAPTHVPLSMHTTRLKVQTLNIQHSTACCSPNHRSKLYLNPSKKQEAHETDEFNSSNFRAKEGQKKPAMLRPRIQSPSSKRKAGT